MHTAAQAPPGYRSLACLFCLPSFLFLLAPVGWLGDAGMGWAILAVLTSVWVAPMFTLLALAIAMIGHSRSEQHSGERRMWTLVVLAIAANLAVSVGGVAARILH